MNDIETKFKTFDFGINKTSFPKFKEDDGQANGPSLLSLPLLKSTGETCS